MRQTELSCVAVARLLFRGTQRPTEFFNRIDPLLTVATVSFQESWSPVRLGI
ncbi:MAG: hypothetical protein ACRETC_07970 [Gammaproteobacteria bacterium]